MVQERKINEIRAIIIVKDLNQADNPRMQRLLDFFQTNKGLSCFLIKQGDYKEICDEHGDAARYIDFGIYENHLLFLTEQYEPEIRGIFTSEITRIENYRSLFDSMWDSRSLTHRNPSKAEQEVTLEELFSFDDVRPVNKGD